MSTEVEMEEIGKIRREERILRDVWFFQLLGGFINSAYPSSCPKDQIELAYSYAEQAVARRRLSDECAGETVH